MSKHHEVSFKNDLCSDVISTECCFNFGASCASWWKISCDVWVWSRNTRLHIVSNASWQSHYDWLGVQLLVCLRCVWWHEALFRYNATAFLGIFGHRLFLQDLSLEQHACWWETSICGICLFLFIVIAFFTLMCLAVRLLKNFWIFCLNVCVYIHKYIHINVLIPRVEFLGFFMSSKLIHLLTWQKIIVDSMRAQFRILRWIIIWMILFQAIVVASLRQATNQGVLTIGEPRIKLWFY